LPEPGNKFGEPGITGINNNLGRAGCRALQRFEYAGGRGYLDHSGPGISVMKPAADDTIISRPKRGGEG
jgi:hypothetical protein